MRFEFADLSLDTDARQLRRGEEPLHLSPKAMDLLTVLIGRPHQLVSKAELYDALWPETYVVDGNLHVLIREIRGAIGDKEHHVIRTVHGRGYSFGISVRALRPVPGGNAPVGIAHTIQHGSREYRLDEGENLVGREPDAQLFLPSTSVSRRHAVISVDGDRATVTDLASKNGTFVGANPVSEAVPIVDGSLLRFGSVEVLYRCCHPSGPTETLRQD